MANERTRPHIPLDKVLPNYFFEETRSRGTRAVVNTRKTIVDGVSSEREVDNGERGGQPWVYSSFGPNRGRKAVDKEVSSAAGRKADLLSRIAEAGRVQLVSGV